MITPQKLTGQWIFTILQTYFREQRDENSEKLFLKINGLSEANIEAVLDTVTTNFESLNHYYKPIVRTITPVEGFSQYSYRDQETSIWLRNNTNNGEALILIINDITSEAQSLENLFSLDESLLLADNGMQSLFYLLQMEYQIAVEEIDVLKTFIEMYKRISEPQLKSILDFTVSILNDKDPSMVTKIQAHLPELNCFKDSRLKVELKDTKRLRSNYYLANLQKSSGSSIDVETIQDKFYSFMAYEEKHNMTHDIWEYATESELTENVLHFINFESKALLNYEYGVISQIFDFKKPKLSLGEKVKDHLEFEERSKEEQSNIQEIAQTLDYENDPDAIESFIDEYQDDLNTNSPLLKSLKRYVEKQRHSSEYSDLLNGVFFESYSLIEENVSADCEADDVSLSISLNSKKISEDSKDLITLYLQNIDKHVPFLSFDGSDLSKRVDTKNAENDVEFKISLFLSGKPMSVDEALFSVKNFDKNEVLRFFDLIDDGYIPYIKQYREEDTFNVSINTFLEGLHGENLNRTEENTVKAYETMQGFLDKYYTYIQSVREKGIFSINEDDLEHEVSNLLFESFSSAQNVNSFFSYINLIGTYDYFDVKPDDTYTNPVERTITIFHPIRLLSYIQKTKEMGAEIKDWIQKSSDGDFEVNQRDEFLDFSISKYSKLSPRYMNRGDDKSFFIEVEESMGNGVFTINNARALNSSNDTREIAKELVGVSKNYLEVFPYAKDGFDILFLHVKHPELVTESIKSLFNSKLNIQKLKITVHSLQPAYVHEVVNNWIEHNEEYVLPMYGHKFPKVEVNVITGQSVSNIQNELEKHMIDADLVVLADYFAQSEQLDFGFERNNHSVTDTWFEKPILEPLKNNEAVKRIPLESDHLPSVLADYYQMEYIAHSNKIPEKDELFVLNQSVSASRFKEGSLIDFMHENYNWNMIIDRFLDKSLLQKASTKAQIIQYKSQSGSDRNFKLMVSSSRNIKRLNTRGTETEYYGRLERKFKQLLRVNHISENNEVQKAVDRVKEISGSLVLRALGPGKFTHELMATNMYIEEIKNDDVFQIVSLCDELPWFSKNRGANKRRPDLVVTTIKEDEGILNIDFNLVELKFILEDLVDREKIDAIKQVKAGMAIYEDLFSFNRDSADTAFWKEEFVNYLIERTDYKLEDIRLLKLLQKANANEISVNVKSEINIYSYDSFLEGYDDNLSIDGIYTDEIEDNIKLYIYNRKYILNKYGVPNTREEVVYSELTDDNELETTDEENNKKHVVDTIGNDVQTNYKDKETKSIYPHNEIGKHQRNSSYDDNSVIQRDLERDESEDTKGRKSNPEDKVKPNEAIYPEQEALAHLELDRETNEDDLKDLTDGFERILVRNFSKVNIAAKVKQTIVGSSVIRIYLEIPADVSPGKVEKKSPDLQLWLGLNTEPSIGIDKEGLYIDINREEPGIVYFEQFMADVREQLEKVIKDNNLITPIGINPLNHVQYIDMADSMTPHLLVGGTTGSGKSVTLNSIILSQMLLYSSDYVRFTFIDPKRVEFTKYENVSHTDEVIYDLDKSVKRLEELCTEMDDRFAQMQENYVSDIKDYNAMTSENKLPHKVIVFDEFADFQSQDKTLAKRVEESIKRLGQKGRAAGMHLILCTQNPKAEVINTTIRSNLPARLALRVTDASSSKIILDETGAQKLAGKGDFLLKDGGSHSNRGKSPFLDPLIQSSLFRYFANK